MFAVKEDGSIVAKKPNPAVPSDLLKEILSWKSEGASMLDVVTRLRQRTVPAGYTIHTWIPGKLKYSYLYLP